MTVHSLRTRTLLVIPIRLVLGVSWLVGARLAGARGGPALLAFVVGALGIAFLIFNDPRSRFVQAEVDPLALPPGTPVAPRWRQALAATLPSTVGVSAPRRDRAPDPADPGRAPRRCLRRPRPRGVDLPHPGRARPVRRPEDPRDLPELRNEREPGSLRRTWFEHGPASFSVRALRYARAELEADGARLGRTRHLGAARATCARRRSATGSAPARATRRPPRPASRTSSSTCSSRAPSAYSAFQIAEIFDGLGGELNAATSREHTLVYARIPDHHLETAMDVMGDMVFAPAFAELDSSAKSCSRRSRCTTTRRRSSCTT